MCNTVEIVKIDKYEAKIDWWCAGVFIILGSISKILQRKKIENREHILENVYHKSTWYVGYWECLAYHKSYHWRLIRNTWNILIKLIIESINIGLKSQPKRRQTRCKPKLILKLPLTLLLRILRFLQHNIFPIINFPNNKELSSQKTEKVYEKWSITLKTNIVKITDYITTINKYKGKEEIELGRK